MNRNAIAGGVLWAGLVAASRLQWARLNTIELLFLLGPLVVVPLGLELSFRLTGETQMGFPIRIARKLQLPAAFCVIASFWLPQGITATILTLPWFVFGSFVGLEGLMALIHGEFRKLKTACRIVSFLYLPIGCAWLVASRLGLSPMGFQEPIVLLTAVHFHFAGFAAPLLALAAASAGEKKSSALQGIFKVVAAGVLAGPGLLAIGFVIGPRLKLAAALLVACSELGLSLVFLANIRSMRPRSAQLLVTISAASVLFAMVLAGVRAIGEFPLQPFVHLDQMARFHGTANAFGFVVCGLVGWTLSARYTTRLEGDPR
jgi:YndJ-like protein